MDCGRLASASELNLRQIGAHTGTSCGRIFATYFPISLERAGVYLFWTTSLKINKKKEDKESKALAREK